MTKNLKATLANASTEERLREAAVKVFALRGFAGATVKEIAELADVNVSLINYHYNGKEGLYRSCIERFGKERLLMAQQLLTLPQNWDDMRNKLRMWMDHVLVAHVEKPDMITIINREMMNEFHLVKDIFESSFLRCFQTLIQFLEEGKARGLVRAGLDTEVAACLIFGGICHTGRTENIRAEFFSKSVRDPEYRMHLVEQMLEIVCVGVKHEKK